MQDSENERFYQVKGQPLRENGNQPVRPGGNGYHAPAPQGQYTQPMPPQQIPPQGQYTQPTPPQQIPPQGQYTQPMPPQQIPPQGQYTPPEQAENQNGRVSRDKMPKKRRRGVIALIVLLIVLTASLLLFQESRLRKVEVFGLTNLSAVDVQAIAGLQDGQSILLIDEKEVAARVNADYRLKFEAVYRKYPNTIWLYVYERTARAYFQFNGVEYTLDKDGMILSASNELYGGDGLILLSGMSVRLADVGRTLTLMTQEQLNTVVSMMEELYQQDYMARVSELNVSDLDNLYLMTVDGSYVRFGNSEDIRAKVGSLRAVMDKLAEIGRGPGEINVSAPVTPTYLPYD